MSAFAVSGCGLVYHSPYVSDDTEHGGNVDVIPITTASLAEANRSTYVPRPLPAFLSADTTVAVPSLASAARTATGDRRHLNRRPPALATAPYRLGVGDVLRFVRMQPASSGNGIAASVPTQAHYTIRDDGSILVPDLGRVALAGMSLAEAEAKVFDRLVERQFDPAFSLEIAEFRSQKVPVGGAVANPTVVPITLTPLSLAEAIAMAGGVEAPDPEQAAVVIRRDGQSYRIPLAEVHGDAGAGRILLAGGDTVLVDPGADPDRAQARADDQLRLAELRYRMRRDALSEERSQFETMLSLGAVQRDYVYLAGEVADQGRFALPFERRASLADAMFEAAGGIPTETGDPTEIYVLRRNPAANGQAGVTAWKLDAGNAANLVLATAFELRPNDVIFVAEQPVTRLGRIIHQLSPTVVTDSADAVN